MIFLRCFGDKSTACQHAIAPGMIPEPIKLAPIRSDTDSHIRKRRRFAPEQPEVASDRKSYWGEGRRALALSVFSYRKRSLVNPC